MISEINAEMLLNYLYPDLMDEWVVRFRGTFYRNYNDDALDYDAKEKKVDLARDGFLKLLPQEYISPEDEQAKDDELKHRLAVLREGFVPIDTMMFRQSLKMEHQVTGMLTMKTEFVLHYIFGIDLDKITNPLIKEAALLLPYVRESRGDVNWVRKMLESLTGCEVEQKLGRWSEDDNTKAWLPYVHYSVVRDGLTQNDFIKLYDMLKELQQFVMDYWMAAETVLKIDLVSHSKNERIGLILDYNTDLR